jgi:hypothetical protein
MSQKNGVFDFYYWMQKFSAYNLWGELSCIFQRISNSASNFALNDIHIEFLQQKFSLLKIALFANSKAKRGQSDFKKTINIFYKCVLSHYTPISDLRASIFFKNVQIVVP